MATETDRRLEEALVELAEHYERAMTRQAEQNERLEAELQRFAAQVTRLEQRVNTLGRDYAGLASALRERSR